jgi:hypothetical protein
MNGTASVGAAAISTTFSPMSSGGGTPKRRCITSTGWCS